MITRQNYEPYFLDYHEGTLSEKLKGELLAFLEANPDLKEEFESFVNIGLTDGAMVTFPERDALKKPVLSNEELTQKAIAAFEGDLSSADTHRLSEIPEFQRELEIVRLTRVEPDFRIIYKEKRSLLRDRKVIVLRSAAFRSMAVAASLAVLLVSYFLLKERELESPVLANQNATDIGDGPVPVVKFGPSSSVGTVQDVRLSPVAVKQRQASAAAGSALAQQPVVKDSSALLIAAQDERSASSAENDNQNFPDRAINTVSPVETQVIPEQPVLASNAPEISTDPRAIFNDEELEELGVSKKQRAGKNSLLHLARRKAKEIGRSSGVTVSREENVVEDNTTYALSVGSFAVRHTRGN